MKESPLRVKGRSAETREASLRPTFSLAVGASTLPGTVNLAPGAAVPLPQANCGDYTLVHGATVFEAQPTWLIRGHAPVAGLLPALLKCDRGIS